MIIFRLVWVIALFPTGENVDFVDGRVAFADDEAFTFDGAEPCRNELVDWATDRYLSAVRRQLCGTCYIWAALTALELHTNMLREWAQAHSTDAAIRSAAFEPRAIDIVNAVACSQRLKDEVLHATAPTDAADVDLFKKGERLAALTESFSDVLIEMDWSVTPNDTEASVYGTSLDIVSADGFRAWLMQHAATMIGDDPPPDAFTGWQSVRIDHFSPDPVTRRWAFSVVISMRVDDEMGAWYAGRVAAAPATFAATVRAPAADGGDDDDAPRVHIAISAMTMRRSDDTCEGGWSVRELDAFYRQQQRARFDAPSVLLRSMPPHARNHAAARGESDAIDAATRCQFSRVPDDELPFLYAVDPFNSDVSRVWGIEEVWDERVVARDWADFTPFLGSAPIYSPMIAAAWPAQGTRVSTRFTPRSLAKDTNSSAALLRVYRSWMRALDYGPLVGSIRTCRAFHELRAHTAPFDNYNCSTFTEESDYTNGHGWHAIVVTGYYYTGDVDTSYFVILNSWDRDWGNGGKAFLKFGSCLLYSGVMPLARISEGMARKYKLDQYPFFNPFLPQPRRDASFQLPMQRSFFRCPLLASDADDGDGDGGARRLLQCAALNADGDARGRFVPYADMSVLAVARDATARATLLGLDLRSKLPAYAVAALRLTFGAPLARDIRVRVHVAAHARRSTDFASTPAAAFVVVGGAAQRVAAGAAAAQLLLPDAAARTPTSRFDFLFIELVDAAPFLSANARDHVRALAANDSMLRECHTAADDLRGVCAPSAAACDGIARSLPSAGDGCDVCCYALRPCALTHGRTRQQTLGARCVKDDDCAERVASLIIPGTCGLTAASNGASCCVRVRAQPESFADVPTVNIAGVALQLDEQRSALFRSAQSGGGGDGGGGGGDDDALTTVAWIVGGVVACLLLTLLAAFVVCACVRLARRGGGNRRHSAQRRSRSGGSLSRRSRRDTGYGSSDGGSRTNTRGVSAVYNPINLQSSKRSTSRSTSRAAVRGRY